MSSGKRGFRSRISFGAPGEAAEPITDRLLSVHRYGDLKLVHDENRDAIDHLLTDAANPIRREGPEKQPHGHFDVAAQRVGKIDGIRARACLTGRDASVKRDAGFSVRESRSSRRERLRP